MRGTVQCQKNYVKFGVGGEHILQHQSRSSHLNMPIILYFYPQAGRGTQRKNYCAGKYGCFTPEEQNQELSDNVYVWSTPGWKPS